MKTTNYILSLLLSIIIVGFSLSAKAEHNIPADDFKANWVVAADLPNPVPANLWFTFRKSFELETVPEKAVCRIACDSKYWLYVNGKMVVFEGGLKRGPTPEDTYYDVVDIADSLQKGKNTIAVLMWYFGKDGFSHKNSGVPGFLFDATFTAANGKKELEILTDESWKGLIYSNLGSLPPKNPDTGLRDSTWREFTVGPYEIYTADPQPNYRLPESNIRYDARFSHSGDWNGPNNWTSVGFDDASWPQV
ncbi:MAG: alpha-L-rhamnosidase N-terminal domain-containing protein, partial [Thermoguttaceae bacterium]